MELNEMCSVLKDLGGQFNLDPTEAEVHVIIQGIDQNHDDKLSLEEFKKLYDIIKESSDNVRAQFDFFDKDGTGFINKVEMRAAMKQLNEGMSKGDLKRMIKEADSDGQINFEEFQRMLV